MIQLLAPSLTSRNVRLCSLIFGSFPFIWAALSQESSTNAPTGPAEQPFAGFTFDQLGAEADKNGGGTTSIAKTVNGALLKAPMQDLQAEATTEGLWLTSTSDKDLEKPNRFRLRAMAIGREMSTDAPVCNVCKGEGDLKQPQVRNGLFVLPSEGTVRAGDDSVAWLRSGLIEEYRVGTNGVRQDFIVLERPEGKIDELVVDLGLAGARAEAVDYGARLTVEATGRELAYSRLLVSDAKGRELPARLEVESDKQIRVVVKDAGAAYPLRIDPTFSDADWVALNPSIPGALGSVFALVADGADNLYVGGNFAVIGSVFASNIAKWNGDNWSALGSGTSGTVSTLTVSGNDLYAGGGFTSAGGTMSNRVAKWNGSAWSALGSGTNSIVSALVASGNDLYAGGSFTMAGGIAASRIAKWDGSAWSALSSGTNDTVNAIVVSGNDLYAGGSFTMAGGTAASRIAKWDGNAWSALSSGTNNTVNALAPSGSDIYVGGNFTAAGGIGAGSVAKWDGSNWSTLGPGLAGSVRALAVSGSELYAGGIFTSTGGTAASQLAKWNGSSWSALGSGVNGTVHALAVKDSDLFVGGAFSMAGETGASRIARWDGSTWSALSPGMNNRVHALVVSGSDLYAGGAFTTAGGTVANRIAKWDGNAWSALGSGMNNTVLAMAVSGTELYAGGEFTTAGGTGAGYIAKWDGSGWSALGSGMDDVVRALAASGSDLYVGGDFTMVDGTTVNRVAKWNGSAWSTLGSGVDNVIRSLAASGGDLYAGGDFTAAGGTVANRIAKWNGSTWSALGSGMNNSVSAMAVSGSDLYAGGDFTLAGGLGASRIAKWNGSAWSALGSGLNSHVYSLVLSGNDLYAGGFFITTGGTAANHIARWNGSTWTALGSGLGGPVNALAADAAGHIFVGGDFLTAGAAFSPYVVQANIGEPEITLTGNGTPILSGDTIASPSNHTDVGSTSISGGSVSRTFTITNDGMADLNLAGNPRVSLGGSGAFSVTTYPSATIVPSGSTTFTITFDPGGAGVHEGNVTIANDDSDENPYTLAIAGFALSDNADLSGLLPGTSSLSPSFESGMTVYTMSVAYPTGILSFTPTGSHSGATLAMRIHGGDWSEINSGAASAPLGLDVGPNLIEIRVTAEDGTPKTYTLTVTREAGVIRPDVAVGSSPHASDGLDAYLPSSQLAALTSRGARPISAYARVRNTGSRPDALVTRSSGGNSFFSIVWFGPAGNATAALRTGSYQTVAISQDDAGDSLRASIKPDKKKLKRTRGGRSIIVQKTLTLPVSASSVFNPELRDAATIQVKTK